MDLLKYIFASVLFVGELALAGQGYGNCRNSKEEGACFVMKQPCVIRQSAKDFIAYSDSKNLSEISEVLGFIQKANPLLSYRLDQYSQKLQVCVVDANLNDYFEEEADVKTQDAARISLWVDYKMQANDGIDSDNLYISLFEYFTNPETIVASRTSAVLSKLFMERAKQFENQKDLDRLFWELSYYIHLYFTEYKNYSKTAEGMMRSFFVSKGFSYYSEAQQILDELWENEEFDIARPIIKFIKKEKIIFKKPLNVDYKYFEIDGLPLLKEQKDLIIFAGKYGFLRGNVLYNSDPLDALKVYEVYQDVGLEGMLSLLRLVYAPSKKTVVGYPTNFSLPFVEYVLKFVLETDYERKLFNNDLKILEERRFKALVEILPVRFF